MVDENITSAVRDFCEAAIQKGNHAPAKLDKKLHARMASAVKQLRSFGEPGLQALCQLMKHDSPHVRSWVATELLAAGELEAKSVLKELAADRGLLGMSAGIVLEQYEAGRLRSPFGTDAA